MTSDRAAGGADAAGPVIVGPPRLDFRILGPLQVLAGNRPLQLGGARQESILAALLLNANRPISMSRLAEIAYGDAPPGGLRRQVQNRVSALRTLLGGTGAAGTIDRCGGGYLIRIARDQLDLFRFEDLVAEARAATGRGDRAGAAATLRAALALWRGPALDGLACDPLRLQVAGLHDARLAALEDRFDLELAGANPDALVPELRAEVALHPLRQRLVGQLMLALHGAGHQADALAVYRDLAARLADEHGLDPTPELRRLQQAILRDDPRRAPPAAPWPPRAGPAQLPLDLPGFAGREQELARLDTIRAALDDQPTAVLIAAIWGTAGVGKTSLAVHWAHRVADRFPDGQLYVNLRGFDPGGPALTPAQALRGFLDGLGVDPGRIPAGLAEQAALYRSRLAGRRMLVVLDNARDAEQLRPLLPGAPGCLVLVTSRNRLASLVAVEGARPVPLDVFTPAEAGDLLAGRLGADRLVIEPGPVDEIIVRCARLPLALAVAAARAATRPESSLAELARELRDARGRLDPFTAGDAASDVRAVFSWSYRILRPAAARLFRLLGLHPGPELSAAAAGSLAGLPVDRVRALLAELAGAHLVTEDPPGRFACHDLLRDYAAELVRTEEDDEVRRAAVHRLLDHYLHTAHPAALLLQDRHESVTPPPRQPGVEPERVADERQAAAWFAAERPVLLAAVDTAARAGFDTHAWQLAWTLVTVLIRRGEWQALTAVGDTALRAAQRLGDRTGQAALHQYLGQACTRLGRHDDAQAHFRRGGELYAELGDDAGRAYVQLDIASGYALRGGYRAALAETDRAFALFEAVDDRRGQAVATSKAAWYHTLLGDHERALGAAQRALRLVREIGNRHAEAATWDTLGYAHHHLGHHREALDCCTRALDQFRELGVRVHEAETLAHLGDIHAAGGDRTAARDAYQQALRIFEELGHPDAGSVRTRLDDQSQPPAATAPRWSGPTG